MHSKCDLQFPRYQALMSIDLRCFDLRQPDYGVRFYQGVEATWQTWPQYNSKAV